MRHLKEESRLDAANGELIGIYQRPIVAVAGPDPQTQLRIDIFFFQTDDKKPVLDRNELLDARWVAVD